MVPFLAVEKRNETVRVSGKKLLKMSLRIVLKWKLRHWEGRQRITLRNKLRNEHHDYALTV
jgi:hypothetical protein